MRQKKKPLEWILSQVPVRDLGWALGYLEKKGMNQLLAQNYQWPPINWNAPPQAALSQVVYLFNSSDFKHHEWLALTDRMMKQAWRTKKARAGANGCKPYSFFMKSEVSPALRQLARTYNRPINQVLESLILQNANGLKAEESPLRKEVRTLQAALKESKRKPSNRDWLSEINALKKTTEAQWKIIERLQFQYEHLLVLTGDPDLQPPTDEQRILISHRCEALLEFHQREIAVAAKSVPKPKLPLDEPNAPPPQETY